MDGGAKKWQRKANFQSRTVRKQTVSSCARSTIRNNTPASRNPSKIRPKLNRAKTVTRNELRTPNRAILDSSTTSDLSSTNKITFQDFRKRVNGFKENAGLASSRSDQGGRWVSWRERRDQIKKSRGESKLILILDGQEQFNLNLQKKVQEVTRLTDF